MINYFGEKTCMYKLVVFNLVIPLFNTNYAGQISQKGLERSTGHVVFFSESAAQDIFNSRALDIFSKYISINKFVITFIMPCAL